MSRVEVRIIRWVEPGYEDAYTQYLIHRHSEGRADLWVTQIALRNNMARAMQSPEPFHRAGTVEHLRAMVESLVQNRCEDGAAVEVACNDLSAT